MLMILLNVDHHYLNYSRNLTSSAMYTVKNSRWYIAKSLLYSILRLYTHYFIIID